ncbi:U-box domain-containing protein kinase family protein [Raphanus sativus]|nr:U-box domain-containing protein kinase family protein [Raphanus sativus]
MSAWRLQFPQFQAPEVQEESLVNEDVGFSAPVNTPQVPAVNQPAANSESSASESSDSTSSSDESDQDAQAPLLSFEFPGTTHKNFVSKIGDVGLAKLISEEAPESVTVYRNSTIAGTLYYLDPEYQRTGTFRPKSDLYAFGIIVLQLLTARHPNGLLFCVEDAVKRGCFGDMLDGSVREWPVAEAEELARIAIKCSQLKCRDRPDLDTQVLPALKRILETANSRLKTEQAKARPPSHYYCPILKEIMEDPQIAADGFTYEGKAIKAWIQNNQNVSPVTKNRLRHCDLTPNHTLKSAIQEWRFRSGLDLSTTLGSF